MYIEKMYRISMFGHRNFDQHLLLDKYLTSFLRELITEKGFVEVYVGRNGEFDIYAASVVKRLQKAVGRENSEIICVLPYVYKDIDLFARYYDSVVIPECISNAFPTSAITIRNKWMVENADLVICYVEKKYGGAYNALKHAERLGKRIINLAEMKNDKLASLGDF